VPRSSTSTSAGPGERTLTGPQPPPALVGRLRATGCVFAEDEARLLAATGLRGDALERLVARRIAGEPLETVLGWVEFAGRRLAVAPGVFVPRRRTQLLARLAASYAGPGRTLLELCCGVAPVAAVVAAGEVHASDVAPAAVACARRNVPHGTVHLSDLYDALPDVLRGRVDVLVANAPYVPTDRIAVMPPEARDHEPAAALDGGPDGVDLHRRIAAGAPGWLAPRGVLLLETSPAQAALTTAAMRDAGLVTRVEHDDEVGGCVAVGIRPGEPG
jgi:release factor glutamine methyltransferase